MISKLHHVQITIPTGGETVARGFYLDLLGLTEIPKPDALRARGGFWLSLAGQEIHVSCEDGINRLATKAHIAYRIAPVAAPQCGRRDSASTGGLEPIEQFGEIHS